MKYEKKEEVGTERKKRSRSSEEQVDVKKHMEKERRE